jgi:hypothetical protein
MPAGAGPLHASEDLSRAPAPCAPPSRGRTAPAAWRPARCRFAPHHPAQRCARAQTPPAGGGRPAWGTPAAAAGTPATSHSQRASVILGVSQSAGQHMQFYRERLPEHRSLGRSMAAVVRWCNSFACQSLSAHTAMIALPSRSLLCCCQARGTTMRVSAHAVTGSPCHCIA